MSLPGTFGGENCTALARRFFRDERGGAGVEYALFVACWSAAVSGGLYLTTPVMTAKFEAVSAALKGHVGTLR